MKVIGLIAEYNPFHFGHEYHINRSKELTDATHTVAVISGSFVQRGEPSIVDKWTKAKIAVENGVDLVLEMPFIYSVQSAELFAYGGVSILDSLNVVDYLSFGTEEKNLKNIKKIAKVLVEEPCKYKESLKFHLDEGSSFSEARSKALTHYIGLIDPDDKTSHDEILKKSNNILGIEYLKALIRLESTITPFSIERKGSKYNDLEVSQISSATGIRNKILNDSLESIKGYVPDSTYVNLEEFICKHESFNYLSKYSEIFQYIFRAVEKSEYSNIFDMENGLDNRIINSGRKYRDIDNIIKDVTTRRYPSTRIKRIMIHLLARLNKESIDKVYGSPINYIRILASNERGLEILRKIKKSSDVNIITKFSDYKSYNDELMNLMLEYEVRSTDIYYLGISKKEPIVNMDFYKSPYIIK